MPNNLTDAEVKKALECCILGDCQGCFYGDTDQRHCKDDLMQNALDLINRTKANEKHYRRKVQNQKEELKRLNEVVNRQQAEIERLEYANETNISSIATLHEQLKTAKAEAYKECIEKVKENSNKMELVCGGALVATDYTITKENLDNLLNELVGDDNSTNIDKQN